MKYLLIVLGLATATIGSSQASRDTTWAQNSTKKENIGLLDMFTGNPGRAALYSAILPSAGQAYNKKYWKIPLVLAAEGTAIGIIVYNNRRYKEWKQAHIGLSNETIQEYKGATTAGQAKSQRDTFEGWRDNAIIATAAIHLVQIAEAFVNRHLMEFDVSEDLSFSFQTDGLSYGLVVTF